MTDPTRALNVLAQAAEAFMIRTEANSAVLVELRHKLNEAITDAKMTLRPSGPAPADEQAPVPPPVDPMKEWTRGLLSRARADKTAPGSPPVDALLNRVDEIAFHADRIARADMSGARDKVDFHNTHYRRERAALRTDLGTLWAAGVEEGRRQATEERTEEQRGDDRG